MTDIVLELFARSVRLSTVTFALIVPRLLKLEFLKFHDVEDAALTTDTPVLAHTPKTSATVNTMVKNFLTFVLIELFIVLPPLMRSAIYYGRHIMLILLNHISTYHFNGSNNQSFAHLLCILYYNIV
jgi:hypothetical protein